MASFVVGLEDLDRTRVATAGGKGANLGELSRLEGVRVPPGFCVTTSAYQHAVEQVPGLGQRLDRLSTVDPDDHRAISALSAEIRRALAGASLPGDVATAITEALARLGDQGAVAVRSSATAEDLPGSSFAGLQESYLNVRGTVAVLRHVTRCWASLFTDRAVSYRLRNGFDHRDVRMAVVVQRLVSPDASGVLFTADPVTGNRTITSIEATYGLGDALVAGLVDPDVYKVRHDAIVERTITPKATAVHPSPDGGTESHPVAPGRRHQPALTDRQVVELAHLGRLIEAHFGRPQDIEWCLAGDELHIVQSRPITTLFPIPHEPDGGNRVYISVGHQQMMTDAMTPLGLSVWQHTAARPMAEAGGRLFVDVTAQLASPTTRAGLLAALGGADPLLRDGLETVLQRDDFLPPAPDDAASLPAALGPPPTVAPDPAVVAELIAEDRASLDALERDIQGRSGPALFEFLLSDFAELRRLLTRPQGLQVIMSALGAAAWLNEHVERWLGDKGAADVLTRSVPGNVTSEMGLALLDVADAIRPHPAVVEYLHHAGDDLLDRLPAIDGGREALDAIGAFLDRYGMRCVGEIDITRPRWRERPSALVPLILANVTSFEPGEAARRFERGRREAAAKASEILARLRALPDGAAKAAETEAMIERVRALAGYREHPKFAMVSRYAIYKRALLAEADRLVRAGVLAEREDAFFLRLDELHDAARTGRVDRALLARHKDEFRAHQALTPPRVLTSDGEAITGSYRRDGLPPDALIGLAVSAGTVEGRARVVLDMAQADLAPGDILVTTHTDPSWSPLFVAAAGLVTEVGGVMTHGSVIAREYGLPAVVGVRDATRLIRDGQRIRVDGTDGYVEVLAVGPDAGRPLVDGPTTGGHDQAPGATP